MDKLSGQTKRAQEFLSHPKYEGVKTDESWGKCQINDTCTLAWTGKTHCLGFSYSGNWNLEEKAYWEALGRLIITKPWDYFLQMSAREPEAFLRDRNSVPSFTDELERVFSVWGQLQADVKLWLTSGKSLADYHFPSQKSFQNLSLVEKIHELKTFLSSTRLAGFYAQGGSLELLDVDDKTIYLAVNAADIPMAPFLDWLQMGLAETFRDPEINIIPEA